MRSTTPPLHITLHGQGGSVPADLTIEGIPVLELAATVEEQIDEGDRIVLGYGDASDGTGLDVVEEAPIDPRLVLSREDLQTYFGLGDALYSPARHSLFMSELQWSRRRDFWFSDLQTPRFATRAMIHVEDLSLEAQRELAAADVSLTHPAFGMTMTDLATETFNEAAGIAWFVFAARWYLGETCSTYDCTERAQILSLMHSLRDDPDRHRAHLVQQYFLAKGCVTITPATDLERSAPCYSQATHTLGIGRVSPDVNTHTEIARTDWHARFLQQHQKFFTQPPLRILDVGPGFAVTAEHCGLAASSQSVEPFMLMNAAIAMGSPPDDVAIDIVDVNSSIVDHFTRAQQRGDIGYPYRLTMARATTELSVASRLIGHLPLHTPETFLPADRRYRDCVQFAISPAVLGQLHPQLADIATSRIAPDASYDLIVMLNVFMYLSPVQITLAKANILRLLKPGGALLTDARDFAPLIEVGHWDNAYDYSATLFIKPSACPPSQR